MGSLERLEVYLENSVNGRFTAGEVVYGKLVVVVRRSMKIQGDCPSVCLSVFLPVLCLSVVCLCMCLSECQSCLSVCQYVQSCALLN